MEELRKQEKNFNNVEIKGFGILSTHVLYHTIINALKIIALIFYIILWTYQAANRQFEVTNDSNDYNERILMGAGFILSICFLFAEVAFIFIIIKSKRFYLAKRRELLAFLIFLMYSALSLALNIFVGIEFLIWDEYSVMIVLLWIIPILSLIEFITCRPKWFKFGEVTIDIIFKSFKTIVIFLYIAIYIIQITRIDDPRSISSYYKTNLLIVFITGPVNLLIEFSFTIHSLFQDLQQQNIIHRIFLIIFFTTYCSIAFSNNYFLLNNVYSITDGLIWVIAAFCFSEIVIKEI
ncbi:16078_t:CDS:1, partial [Dentiscutata erythropus]